MPPQVPARLPAPWSPQTTPLTPGSPLRRRRQSRSASRCGWTTCLQACGCPATLTARVRSSTATTAAVTRPRRMLPCQVQG